jgi:two-component system OmpR family sensor kinase
MDREGAPRRPRTAVLFYRFHRPRNDEPRRGRSAAGGKCRFLFVFDSWNVLLQPYTLIALAVLISGAGSALLARYLTRPVSRLREGVRGFAGGNLDTRMDTSLRGRCDELGALARDFDRMATNLRALIASKEELLRDVSHELRSPLARLRVAASLARRGSREARQFDRIDCEVERLDAMLGQLLRFSRLATAPRPVLEDVSLSDIAEECVADAAVEAAVAQKNIELSLLQDVRVRGDRSMLRSAIENVLRNAVRFAPGKSRIHVVLGRSGDSAAISIADCGPGVAKEHLTEIFEPFFRASAGDGVGLGLSIAQRIVTIHGGTISASNGAAGGLRVTLFLPVEESVARALTPV